MIRALLALLFLALPCAAEAACALATTTPLTFAQSSSYDVKANAVSQISGTGGFSCAGTLIVLLGTNQAKATVSSANGFKLKVGSDAIPYTLSADAAGTQVFTQNGSVNYMDPSILSLLNILNGGAFAPKMFASINGAANVAAGTYTDRLTVNWDWSVCHLLNLAGVCILAETGTGTSYVDVSITVSKDCRITAPNVSLGSVALVSQFVAATPTILTDCTKGATYNVSFTSGTSGASRPWRAMSDGAGHSLQYNVYRADGTTIWDETNPAAATLPGTGATVPAQIQSYQVKVNPTQATPPPGHYTDTLSVVVSF